MNFKEMKNQLERMMEEDHQTFVKALISAEKGITNYETLDSLYQYFMETDGMNLLSDDFDEQLNLLQEQGYEMDYVEQPEVKEVVGNLTADIKLQTVGEGSSSFQVANFSIVQKGEDEQKHYTNLSAYGEQASAVQDLKKGDFVKFTGIEKTVTKGDKAYTSVTVRTSHLLKVRSQMKSQEHEKTDKPSTLEALKHFKGQSQDSVTKTDKVSEKGLEI